VEPVEALLNSAVFFSVFHFVKANPTAGLLRVWLVLHGEMVDEEVDFDLLHAHVFKLVDAVHFCRRVNEKVLLCAR